MMSQKVQAVSKQKARTSQKNSWWKGIIDSHFRHRGCLDEGLTTLQCNLGLDSSPEQTPHHIEKTKATPTSSHMRNIFYAPDMDGQADPGEVVWFNLRLEKTSTPERRSALIIGRNEHILLLLIISSNPEHEGKDNWLRIGAGPWDKQATDCWIRLDKVIEVPETSTLRRGVSMPQRRFDRIAAALRTEYGWT